MKATNVLHISHTDLDGEACLILTNMIVNGFPDGMFNLEEKSILPSKIIPTLKLVINSLPRYDRVIITDIAVSLIAANMIKNCANPEKFIWVDHHETPIVNLEDYPFLHIRKKVTMVKSDDLHLDGTYDNGIEKAISAAWLYYQILIRDKIFNINILQLQNEKYLNHFIETVSMYDTFEFTKYEPQNGIKNEEWSLAADDAKRLNTLFYTITRKEFNDYIINYISGAEIPFYSLTHSSEAYPWIDKVIDIAIEQNENYIKAAMKKAQKLKLSYKASTVNTLLEFNISLVYSERNGPAIGSAILQNNKDIDIVFVVTNNQVSLYTNKENGRNIDVAAIAAIFGGGGHANAAGFTLQYKDTNRLERIRFESMLSLGENGL